MDSFEFTKIAAAVLCALLLIFGSKTAIDLSQSGHSAADVAGFKLPEPAAEAPADAAAAPVAGFSFAAIAPLLAAAKPENGQAVFKKCAACHSPDKEGANKVGPALWGVVGRKIGSKDGFGYSTALTGKGGEWTYEALAAFVHNPKGYAAGTKMVFAGLNDNAQIADLLAYLRSLSDSPAPLP